MSVREYIGARYVPVFADPIEWDGTLSYEPLTVVKYQGASYVSRQWVPEGTPLSSTDFWILWADYNAQLEAYRQEVLTFDGRITANTEGVAENADEIAAIKAANWVTNVRIADNAVTTGKIADNAVTTGKIADEAVTGAKIADHAIDSGHLAEDSVTAFAIEDKTITPDKLTDKYLVVIGDSYSNSAQTGTPLWHTLYAANHSLKVHTTASDGVGFATGVNNFQVQLTNAITAMQGKDVAEVIIIGGLNDFHNTSLTPTQIGTAAKTIVDNTIAAFPNATVKVGIFPPFQKFGFYSNNYSDKSRAVNCASYMYFMLQTTKATLYDLTTLGLFVPEFFGPENSSGQRHPASRGSAIIANAMAGGSIMATTFPTPSNSPALYAFINSNNHVNCAIISGQTHVRTKSGSIIELSTAFTVSDVNSVSRLDVSMLPMCGDYMPCISGTGAVRMAYLVDPGFSQIYIPAMSDGGTTRYISLQIDMGV